MNKCTKIEAEGIKYVMELNKKEMRTPHKQKQCQHSSPRQYTSEKTPRCHMYWMRNWNQNRPRKSTFIPQCMPQAEYDAMLRAVQYAQKLSVGRIVETTAFQSPNFYFSTISSLGRIHSRFRMHRVYNAVGPRPSDQHPACSVHERANDSINSRRASKTADING